jgi:hypothetical protein
MNVFGMETVNKIKILISMPMKQKGMNSKPSDYITSKSLNTYFCLKIWADLSQEVVAYRVQLGPLGTAATNGLLCQPRVIMMTEKLVTCLAGETEYSEKTCPSAALSTTNPTCCMDANPGLRGGKPATNRLSYGTANLFCYCCSQIFYSSIISLYIMTLTGILVTRYGNKTQFYPHSLLDHNHR